MNDTSDRARDHFVQPHLVHPDFSNRRPEECTVRLTRQSASDPELSERLELVRIDGEKAIGTLVEPVISLE